MSTISWECIAFDGKKVSHGENFVPGPDNCTACKCEKGEARFCRAALCQPPQDCRSFRVGDSCCDFICLDDILPTLHNDVNIRSPHDTGLRMVASSIVAILSLALLLFLIHRLRKRKLRSFATQQQFIEEQGDVLTNFSNDARRNSPWGRDTAVYLSGNDHVDFFLNGCPPPYAPWKPPSYYFQSGTDAPPPYSEVVANDRSQAEATRLPSLSPLMVELISRQPLQGPSVRNSLRAQIQESVNSSAEITRANIDCNSLPQQSSVSSSISLPLNQESGNCVSFEGSSIIVKTSSQPVLESNQSLDSTDDSIEGNNSTSRDASQSDSVSSTNNSTATYSHRSSDPSLSSSSLEPGGENDFRGDNSLGSSSDHDSPSKSSGDTSSSQDISSSSSSSERGT